MGRRLVLTVAALACGGIVATAASGAGGLEPRLTRALTSPSLSLGQTAAFAVDLSTGEALYGHNSDKPMAPASNEKLPVSFTALSTLGPGYRFHTEVYGVGRREGSTWSGDLFLKGYGDPTLARADLDRLAGVLRGRGIRAITGRVFGDESFYDRRRAGDGWKRSFLGGESPPLSALVVDRARGWPALSPPLLAARALTDALSRRGTAVSGRPGVGVTPASAITLASDTSDPLTLVVRRMNHESDNFYAEMLLKQLGATSGAVGSSVGGAKVVLATLRDARIPVQGVRIVDGSGLSSLDRLTAATLVGVLRAGATDPTIRGAFIGSLAVAGWSGTLSDRLPALRGKVVGKTGTTNLACTLSGLVRRRIVFAVLENGNPVSSWESRAAQDRFVTILASATEG